jgi:hypothetical protein
MTDQFDVIASALLILVIAVIFLYMVEGGQDEER